MKKGLVILRGGCRGYFDEMEVEENYEGVENYMELRGESIGGEEEDMEEFMFSYVCEFRGSKIGVMGIDEEEFEVIVEKDILREEEIKLFDGMEMMYEVEEFFGI